MGVVTKRSQKSPNLWKATIDQSMWQALQQAVELYISTVSSSKPAISKSSASWLPLCRKSISTNSRCPPLSAVRQLVPEEESSPARPATCTYQMAGVDLTQVDGLDILSVQTLLSEIGTDMSKWKASNTSPPGWAYLRNRRRLAAK